MPTVDKINAISRFVLYASVALAIYYRRVEVLAAGVIVAAIYAFYGSRSIEKYTTVADVQQQSPLLTGPPAGIQSNVNPFGNPLAGETPVGSVAPYDAEMAKSFYAVGLPRDNDDYEDRRTRPWNFGPLPDRSGVADYTGFARELARPIGDTCKTDQTRCTGWAAGG